MARVLHNSLAIAVILSFMLGLTCCEDHLISTITDAPFEVSSDWVTLTPKEAVVARRKVREVQVWVPEGQDVRAIEAQLIDQNALERVFDWNGRSHGSEHADVLVIETKGLPEGQVVRSVRLRSSSLIQCLRVEWVCYNPEDTKTGE